jgi:hypothetical protein
MARGDVPIWGVARWNGESWSDLGFCDSGSRCYISALTIDDNENLYACGYDRYHTSYFESEERIYNIMKWDGITWSALGMGFNSIANTLELDDSGNIYAGGRFTAPGPGDTKMRYNFLAKWDGTEWVPLGSGTDNEVLALDFDQDGSLYVGGFFRVAGNKPSLYIARWDVASANVASE